MNAEEALDHVFGSLEGRERALFESRLRADPGLAERLDRLTASIHRLLDDGRAHDPPAGLADRTITLLAQSKTRAVRPPFHDQPATRAWFRWADLAVAASILFVGVLTIIPLLQYARDRRNYAACAFNLREIGRDLALYTTSHPNYPYPEPDHLDDPAGVFAVMLHDDGLIPDLGILDCPSNGPRDQQIHQFPRYADLEVIRKTDPERFQRLVGMSDYAFHAGYRRPTGRLGPLESRLAEVVPLVADKPGYDHQHAVTPGNSPNHGLRGQNVLFTDGGVRWRNSRFVSSHDPDIFLNNDNDARPGTHALDSVLLPGPAPFRGR